MENRGFLQIHSVTRVLLFFGLNFSEIFLYGYFMTLTRARKVLSISRVRSGAVTRALVFNMFPMGQKIRSKVSLARLMPHDVATIVPIWIFKRVSNVPTNREVRALRQERTTPIPYVTAFLQTDLFLVYLFRKKRQ